MYFDDHRSWRPRVRSDLRIRHHRLRCRAVGATLDNLRHLPGGVTLAKQRLMTAVFAYYDLAHPEEGVGSGFNYKTVPHITLGSIANNPTSARG